MFLNERLSRRPGLLHPMIAWRMNEISGPFRFSRATRVSLLAVALLAPVSAAAPWYVEDDGQSKCEPVSALDVSTPEEYSQQIHSRGGEAHFARTLDPDTGKEDDILYWNILRNRDDRDSQITVVWFRDKKQCEIILDRVRHRYESE
jgi:hypothetical protein